MTDPDADLPDTRVEYRPATPPDAATLFAALRGDHPRRALGRAITLLESSRPADRATADELIDLALAANPEGTFRLGVSGTPGVGKSTFIEAFGQEVVRRGHRLAVLAVDPSSGVSGGSILGDKTRMEVLSRLPEAFIRPSPTGGYLGGVGPGSRAAILLCEAAGYDYVIVETVGVGQAEWRVHGMTDAFLLLAQPGAGDDLQGIKRGILELADYLLVNKTDQLPDAARQAALELRRGLHLAPPRPDSWTVKVDEISALTGDGIAGVYDHLATYRRGAAESGRLRDRRRGQLITWLRERAEHELLSGFRRHLAQRGAASDGLARFLDQHSSLSSAVDVILADFMQRKT